MAEPAFAFGELLKLLVALGVTIGLFYALALFMKRLQVGTGKSGSLITVLGAMPLGGKEKIWIVDVAGEKLVIGTTPGNVNCLHVLKGEVAAAPGNADKPAPGLAEAGSSSFPRMRESRLATAEPAALDTDLRRNDAVPAPGFAELLNKFRGWQK
ncbi:MAG: flagellar biosynthetic protein FliO [Gammaproteobacteria bacterium]